MERRCFVKLPMPGRPTNLENSKNKNTYPTTKHPNIWKWLHEIGTHYYIVHTAFVFS